MGVAHYTCFLSCRWLTRRLPFMERERSNSSSSQVKERVNVVINSNWASYRKRLCNTCSSRSSSFFADCNGLGNLGQMTFTCRKFALASSAHFWQYFRCLLCNDSLYGRQWQRMCVITCESCQFMCFFIIFIYRATCFSKGQIRKSVSINKHFETLLFINYFRGQSHGSESMNWREPTSSSSNSSKSFSPQMFHSPSSTFSQYKDMPPPQDHIDNVAFLNSRMQRCFHFFSVYRIIYVFWCLYEHKYSSNEHLKICWFLLLTFYVCELSIALLFSAL